MYRKLGYKPKGKSAFRPGYVTSLRLHDMHQTNYDLFKKLKNK